MGNPNYPPPAPYTGDVGVDNQSHPTTVSLLFACLMLFLLTVMSLRSLQIIVGAKLTMADTTSPLSQVLLGSSIMPPWLYVFLSHILVFIYPSDWPSNCRN